MTSPLEDAWADIVSAAERVRALDERAMAAGVVGNLVVVYVVQSLDEDDDVQTQVGYMVQNGHQPLHITLGMLAVSSDLARNALRDTP